ncbi:MAG TPA: PQQ-binding-like beta-propeller repeat protein [Pyrinomonadaceae bacterium]|nr:PQQ-binding-like beta-propeller repeat protein [Pyrinomonadaceae bacterium]
MRLCGALALLGSVLLPNTGTAQAEKAPNSPLIKCWSHPANVLPHNGIATDSDNVYFVSGENKVNAIDVKTGETVWSSEVGGNLISEIVVTNRSIYAVSAGASETGPTFLRSLSRSTGLTTWSVELRFAEKYFIGETTAGIVVAASNGDIWTINEGDGTMKWKGAFTGTLSAPPRIGKAGIVIGTTAKKVEVFAAADGKRVRSMDVQFVPALVGNGTSSAAVYSDERGGVYSSEIDSGQRNWKFKAGGKIGDMLTFEWKILVSSADNFVYLMSADYGNILWKRRMPGRIANSGLIAADLAAVTVIGERMAYVIDLDSGRIVDQIALTGDDAFLLTSIRANGEYVIAATANGLTGFSTGCGKDKRPSEKLIR